MHFRIQKYLHARIDFNRSLTERASLIFKEDVVFGILKRTINILTICKIILCFRMLNKQTCQMLLFSATYDDQVMDFAQAVIPRSPIVIKLRREEESLDNIKQFYIECTDVEAKFHALSNIYGTISIGQSMIFCAVSNTLQLTGIFI